MAWRAFGNPKYTKRMIQLAKKVLDVVESKEAKSSKESFVCFAFMPDKQTGKHEFALDTGIAGEMLFKKMRTFSNAERGKKKEKKLTKGAWGTCQIKGKTLYVMPEQDVPSLRMLLKKRLLSEEFKEFKLNECRILKPGEKPPADADDKKKGDPDETLDPFQGKGKSKKGGASGSPADPDATLDPFAGKEKPKRGRASGSPADPDETLDPFQGKGKSKKGGASGSPADSDAPLDPFKGKREPKPKSGGKKGGASGSPADPDATVNPFTGEAVEQAAPAAAKHGARSAKEARAQKKAASRRRAEFKKARKTWVGVRDKAIRDLEVVKDAVRDEYMDDPHIKEVNQHLHEFDEVVENLSDDLREALDAYVATPLDRDKELEQHSQHVQKLLNEFSRYVDKSKLLAAVDEEKAFAGVQNIKLKAPISKALKSLARSIR